jgi:hypothetical protein
MSVAQILEEAKSFSVQEIEELEISLRLQRLQKMGKIASPEESRLISLINTPLPLTERFQELRVKLEQDALSEDERREMLDINGLREAANATRVEAVMELAKLKGKPFADLWQQMVGAPQGTRFVSP